MHSITVFALLFRLAACLTPREGAEYALLSSDGRYLVADAEKGLLLLPPSEAGVRRKFEFVRVDSPETELVYLQFGEVLLTAYTASGGAEPQFQLYTRGDGRVASSCANGQNIEYIYDGIGYSRYIRYILIYLLLYRSSRIVWHGSEDDDVPV